MRLALIAFASLSSCAGPRLFGDGTSVSVGTHANGSVRRPARLSLQGDGYTVPTEWRRRESSYGTDELVELIVRASRRVRREHPGAVLGVADLSRRAGGASPEHRSHQNGRDADLIPYAVGLKGRPLPPPMQVMLPFSSNGVARLPTGGAASAWIGERDLGPEPRRFDDARNWALVRALLTDPVVEVQWLFVAASLEQRLLRFAASRREPAALLAQASEVMHQPGDAQAHDDHFHLRVFCAPADRALGCADRGPARWLKKSLKRGMDPVAGRVRLPEVARRIFAGPAWHPL
ncbi:MAG: penicillin-insensitive murein endopeptidase [Myxococcota bacterium]